MRLFFPWFPPELNPNYKRKMNWQKKKRIYDEYQDTIFKLCAHQKVYILKPSPVKIKATIIFYPPQLRVNRNLDNCLSATKGLWDVLARKLGVDDAVFYPITLDWGQVKRGGEIEIILEEP
jgi:Holliday junction resolvase RusA-like endonuclease